MALVNGGFLKCMDIIIKEILVNSLKATKTKKKWLIGPLENSGEQSRAIFALFSWFRIYSLPHQTTHFRLFQTQSLQTRMFNMMEKAESFPNR